MTLYCLRRRVARLRWVLLPCCINTIKAGLFLRTFIISKVKFDENVLSIFRLFFMDMWDARALCCCCCSGYFGAWLLRSHSFTGTHNTERDVMRKCSGVHTSSHLTAHRFQSSFWKSQERWSTPCRNTTRALLSTSISFVWLAPPLKWWRTSCIHVAFTTSVPEVLQGQQEHPRDH